MALLFGKSTLLLHQLFSYNTPTSLRPTAWLDGLRGVAALEVALFHYADLWTVTDTAFNGSGAEGQWLRLPLIRTFYCSGRAMVCLFFIISGIVLTQRTMLLIRKNDLLGAYLSLTSSTFRRALRLFPSPVISSFLAMLLFRYFHVTPYGATEQSVPYMSTVVDQIMHWAKDTIRYLNLFEPNLKTPIVDGIFGGHAYSNIIWTIPMEFAGSLACYIQVLGTARLQPHVRNYILLVIGLFGLVTQRWALFNFNIGIILGDCMLAEALDAPRAPLSRKAKFGYVLLFIAGFWFAGMPMRGPLLPDSNRVAFGYTTIWKLTPERFLSHNFNFTWWSASSIALLWSCYRLQALRRVLEGGLCQYLGKLSFSLYLLHIIVRDCIGESLRRFLLSAFGSHEASPALQQALPCFLWYLVLILLTLIVSGIFEKQIDLRIIHLAKHVENRLTAMGQQNAELPMSMKSTASV